MRELLMCVVLAFVPHELTREEAELIASRMPEPYASQFLNGNPVETNPCERKIFIRNRKWRMKWK